MKGLALRSLLSPTNASGKAAAEDAIDVVVAWVDGSDRKHRRKRDRYLADPGANGQPERVASKDRRFSDNDEIRFCLRSIRNYAPWVRTIWLVTDNQIPASIDRRNAERDGIRIVDHREIFRGYQQLLPTFNSLAIESMLWRIEGLADRFLYFNDDMMLVGPVKPTDFFSDEGKVNLRGRWNNWKGQPEEEISFFGSNKLLGAEMLGYTPEHFFLLRPCDLSPAATGHGRAVCGVPARLPRQRRVPLPQPQAVLADLGPQSLVAQVGPRTGAEATELGAFLQPLLSDGQPRRPRSTATAADGWHHAHDLHQLPRSRCRQGAKCDELSVAGHRAGGALREAVAWDVLTPYFMLWMIESTLVAPSAGLVLPKSTSVPMGRNSLLKPEALAGVT